MISELDFPERITIELTSECNYQCRMCPSRWNSSWARGYMAPALFRELVRQAAGHPPVTLVPFFRGESLLHPDLVEFLSLAKAAGLKPIQLSTNGSLLTGKLAQGLLDSGLDFISFSLDTMRPEEYARIRRGGRLDSVGANIERFLNLKDRGGYSTEVQISATRTELNRDSLKEFIGYWRPRADRVRIYYEHSTDGHTGSLDHPDLKTDVPRQACHKVFHDLVVYYDGRVAACNHDWFRDPPLGDLTRQSIREVWHGRPYQRLRRQHLNPSLLEDETCLYCDHWQIQYLKPPFIGELYQGRRMGPEDRKASEPVFREKKAVTPAG